MVVNPWPRFVRTASGVLITLIVGIAAAWGVFALWYQLPREGVLKTLGVTLWAVFSVTVLVALWSRRIAQALWAFSATFALLLVWWHLIPPSNDRIWADDVAQMTSGTVDGQHVTLHNVRSFD